MYLKSLGLQQAVLFINKILFTSPSFDDTPQVLAASDNTYTFPTVCECSDLQCM